MSTVIVINQEAALSPVRFRQIEHFELNESSLSGATSCLVHVLRAVILGWHVLDNCQVLNLLARLIFIERTGLLLCLLRHLGHLYVIFKSHLRYFLIHLLKTS